MFRFFEVVGFSYFATLILADCIPIKFIFFVLFLTALVFIIVLVVEKFRRNKVLPIAFLTAFIALSLYAVNFYFNVKPVYDLGEKDVSVSGKIVEIPSKTLDGKYKYIFEVDRIMGMAEPRNFKIELLSNNPIEADVYGNFIGDIHIYHPENTPEFSAQNFYKSKSIYALGFLYDYKPNHTEPATGIKPIYYYALKARSILISTVKVILPQKQASVVNGILFGDKANIDNDVKMDFDRIGVYHLLAVSGVHITILSSLLIIFLRRMKLGMRVSNIISVCAILAFMAVTCFTPSVVRAGIMLILCLLGAIIFRNPDPINSLGISVLLIILFDINSAGNVGLWLSFLSTLGIIVLEPILKAWIENKFSICKDLNVFWGYILDSVLVTVSSCILTMPVIFLHYKKFSLISLVSNILLIFPVGIMVGSAIVLIFLRLLSFPIFIFMPIKILCGITVNYIIWCADILSRIPFATVSVDYMFVRIWISASLLLFGIAFFYGDTRKNIKLASLISVNLFIVGLIIDKILMHDITRVSVLNIGEGCTLALSRNGRNSLMFYGNDKSNKQKIIQYLYKINAYKIDYLIVPSYGPGDIKFINNIKKIYNPDITLLKKYPDVNIDVLGTDKVTYFESDFSSLIWDDIKLFSKEVKGSVFSRLSLDNKNILVCPYGGNLQDSLVNGVNCDVLIAGALPSNYKQINSTYNVFSMNTYDSKVVIPKFDNVKNKVFSTAFYGNVNIDIKKRGKLLVRRRI